MEDILPFCLVGLTLVGLPAVLIFLTMLVPEYVARAQATIRDHPLRSFLLGLLNFLFFAAISSLVEVGFPPAAFAGGFSLVVVLPIFLLAGLLIAAGVVGEQIWLHVKSQSDKRVGLLRFQIVGILIMGLMLLIPIFGWLVFLGLVFTGLGANLMTLLRRNGSIPTVSEPEPPSVPAASETSAE